MSVLFILLAILVTLLLCAGAWWLLGQTTLTPNMKVIAMLILIIIILIFVFSIGPSLKLPI